MQANTLTPQKLFEPQVRYVIPVFQRPYVWEVEKQWGPLWADIRAVADELLETQNLAQPAEVSAHFLGRSCWTSSPTCPVTSRSGT